jgi:hypothetical protein
MYTQEEANFSVFLKDHRHAQGRTSGLLYLQSQ